MATPRLRMFAGPNGSGKSTLKTVLPPDLLGVYVNPDEIEKAMVERGCLDLPSYGVTTGAEEILRFFREATLLSNVGLGETANKLRFVDERLYLNSGVANSYFASVAADFLRKKLLEQRSNFTFETVMSHPSKVHILEAAQSLGYRTYLYFICTEDPAINISRVQNRVKQGGHAVPEDKIKTRYDRCLKLLKDAITHTNRAYLFDNSGEGSERTWFAEITEGKTIEYRCDVIPQWFTNAVEQGSS